VTVTNQHLIQEEMKRRFNSGNACSHLVQNVVSSCLLLNNLKIRIYKTYFASGSMWVLNMFSDIKGGT
jgi:hypothetical protein